jgi:DNA-binding MarR family transcriptional regulator
MVGAGTALFRIVRFWARRWALGAAGDERRVHAIMVLEAVDGAARADVSVADVAHELGIDHSGASRFVTAAISDGYLRRAPSTVDRRRAALAVTPSGRTLLAAARAWQDGVFAELTANWPPADAKRFADYLRRLAAQLGEA